MARPAGASSRATDEQKQKRRTLLGILLILCALVLLGILIFQLVTEGKSKGPNRSPASGSASGATAANDQPAPNRLPPQAKGPKPQAPIIDDVTIEKTEVCEGEENLVSVKAHTPGHRDDPYLRILVMGHGGSSVPLRAYLNEDGSQPVFWVTVYGRQSTLAKKKIPFFRVKKCRLPNRLAIYERALPNTRDSRELWVKVLNHDPSKPFKPVRYIWNFGDGSKQQTTTVPLVTHDYKTRIQDSAWSNFLVTVTAISASGAKLMGRRSLQIKNFAFDFYSRTGTILLLTELSPRYPKLNAQGVSEQRVLIWHYHRTPVTITRVTTQTYMDPKEGYPADQPTPEEVSVTSVLGTRTIPPEGIETSVRLDVKHNPRIRWIRYELLGFADKDTPARGGFSLMRPTALPTRKKHTKVSKLLGKLIQRSREILGKEFVSQEDIMRLYRSGQLDEFKGEIDAWRRKQGLDRLNRDFWRNFGNPGTPRSGK